LTTTVSITETCFLQNRKKKNIYITQTTNI